MGLSPEMLKGMSYAAGGGVLVFMSVWLMFNLLRRSVKRADSEGSLDQRAVKQVEAIQTTYDKLVDELRATVASQDSKIGRLHEELFASHKRFGELVGMQQTAINQEVSRVREVHEKALDRVHKRLDQCETQHGKCREEQQETRGELTVLRQMISEIKPANFNVNMAPTRKATPADQPAP